MLSSRTHVRRSEWKKSRKPRAHNISNNSCSNCRRSRSAIRLWPQQNSSSHPGSSSENGWQESATVNSFLNRGLLHSKITAQRKSASDDKRLTNFSSLFVFSSAKSLNCWSEKKAVLCRTIALWICYERLTKNNTSAWPSTANFANRLSRKREATLLSQSNSGRLPTVINLNKKQHISIVAP